MKVIRRWRKSYLKTNCPKCNKKLKITKDNTNIKDQGTFAVGGYICPKCKRVIFISLRELVKIY